MSIESPTLKVRFAMPDDHSFLGRDCHSVAEGIASAVESGPLVGLQVLAAKWGRTPTDWRATGASWGRQKLTEYERGYLDAARASSDVGLVAIIDRLVGGAAS